MYRGLIKLSHLFRFRVFIFSGRKIVIVQIYYMVSDIPKDSRHNNKPLLKFLSCERQ